MVAGTMPAVWSDPPGVPGVACRRGTCGCPGIESEPGAKSSVYREPALLTVLYPPPRICRQPKATSAAPAARLCDGVGSAGRPRAASPKRRSPQAKAAEGHQLRRILANADAQHRVCRRSGGTGSGGTPDKCGGKL
jgi:hypothetical protein